MIRIEYEHNVQEKVVALLLLYAAFESSRKSALSSVGFLLMEEMRDRIESFPHSSNPLTLFYQKKYGKEYSFGKRHFSSPGTPFFWLSKFSRYVISPRADQMKMGFGNFKKKQPGRFDYNLQQIGARVQSGNSIPVTDAMRRKIAAGTRGEVAIRKSTTTLEVPPRDIEKTVMRKKSAEVFPLFQAKFAQSLQRKFARL